MREVPIGNDTMMTTTTTMMMMMMMMMMRGKGMVVWMEM